MIMTVAYLRKVLEKFDPDGSKSNSEVFIAISGTHFGLSMKVDKLFVTYEDANNPGAERIQESICFFTTDEESKTEQQINPN